MKRLRAALVALLLAVPLVYALTADDILRAFCAGIGTEHPLYDLLGCPALMTPDPQG